MVAGYSAGRHRGGVGALDALPDAVPDGAARGIENAKPRALPLISPPRCAAGVRLNPEAPPPMAPLPAGPGSGPASCDGCHLPMELLPDGPDLSSLEPPPEPPPDPAVVTTHQETAQGSNALSPTP